MKKIIYLALCLFCFFALSGYSAWAEENKTFQNALAEALRESFSNVSQEENNITVTITEKDVEAAKKRIAAEKTEIDVSVTPEKTIEYRGKCFEGGGKKDCFEIYFLDKCVNNIGTCEVLRLPNGQVVYTDPICSGTSIIDIEEIDGSIYMVAKNGVYLVLENDLKPVLALQKGYTISKETLSASTRSVNDSYPFRYYAVNRFNEKHVSEEFGGFIGFDSKKGWVQYEFSLAEDLCFYNIYSCSDNETNPACKIWVIDYQEDGQLQLKNISFNLRTGKFDLK